MKKAMKWIIGVVVLAAIAGGAWWWLKPQDKTAYITEPVKRATISQTVSATGEILASQMVDVGAQASGQIKKLHVKLGQEVKKGDLIAEIDSTTQVNTLNTNKAKLETFQAQLASADIALRSAEKKYKREQALWKEKATSKADLETAEDNFAAAKKRTALCRISELFPVERMAHRQDFALVKAFCACCRTNGIGRFNHQ